MRTITSVSAVAVTAAASLLLAPAAFASGGNSELLVPGNNGTVKIHDAETDEELAKNEPKVCEFYLVGTGFDPGQQVFWKIEEIPPTGGGEVADTGAIELDGEGYGHTEDIGLPDGHYKLYWLFKPAPSTASPTDGPSASATASPTVRPTVLPTFSPGGGATPSIKHKVFWVDCEDEETDGGQSTGETTGDTSEGTTGDTDGGQTTGDTSEGTTGDTDGGQTTGDTSEGTTGGETPQGGGDDLAETGASVPVGALGVGAALLVGAGSYLVIRRRGSARG